MYRDAVQFARVPQGQVLFSLEVSDRRFPPQLEQKTGADDRDAAQGHRGARHPRRQHESDGAEGPRGQWNACEMSSRHVRGRVNVHDYLEDCKCWRT
jgi:hypothetical protein